MRPSFNLLDEGWIPCLMSDHTRAKLSLKEVLVRSHEVSEILHASPLVVTALHRLLLAILHRNFGPATLDDWKYLWKQGRWDGEVLATYLSRWRHRFDLFDEERPFFQVPYMEEARRHPAQILALEAASGNNATLFDHNFSDRPVPFSPAQAALYVVARQAFSIGFGKSKPFYFQDSPLVRGYTVSILGDTLWETLVLNLQPYNPERPIPHLKADLPVWEQDLVTEPDQNGTPIEGYLHYLSWQSRRLHLVPEGDPVRVSYCQIQQGFKLPDHAGLDPFKCYRKDEEQGWVPIGIRPERALWRDSHTLFQVADKSIRRPEVFNWVSRIEALRRRGEISARRSYRFSITGLATEVGKAANLILWRQERLPLPTSYLEDEDLLGRLRVAIALAEEVESALTGSIFRIARLVLAPDSERPGARRPDRREVNRLVGALAPGLLYWSKLESPFRAFLVDLAQDVDKDQEGEPVYGQRVLPQWFETLRLAASEAFKQTINGFECSTRTLRAAAKAEGQFWRQLKSTFNRYQKEVINELDA